jgi:hypothetical protein
MGEQRPGNLLMWRSGFRLVVVVTWLLMVAAWSLPKTVVVAAFSWFRAVAVLGAAYVVYECAQVLKKRISVRGMVLDVALVLSMFAFWFIVLAATY